MPILDMVTSRLHTYALSLLEQYGMPIAAEKVFGNLVKSSFAKGLSLWKGCVGTWPDYIFGSTTADQEVLTAAQRSKDSRNCVVVPLYLLCYIFEEDELTPTQIAAGSADTAQYSIHVVALVFDPVSTTVLVLDPNGGLIGGGNMEHLAIPLNCR